MGIPAEGTMSDVTSHGETNAFEPGDEVTGGWSFEALHLMNERFVARVRRAIACGLEAPPQAAFEGPVRAYSGPTCAHCGKPFATTRSDKKYCSQWCCQAAYRKRRDAAASSAINDQCSDIPKSRSAR
jgi:hypothetical protein